MLEVRQFRYNNDNLGYVVHGVREAIVIDGGAHHDILTFLKKRELRVLFIVNTHNHLDHTVGNPMLKESTNALFLSCDELVREKEIALEGEKIFVLETPGHTEDSLCFYTGNVLLSGDTLFNGTVGNCFTGNLYTFYESILKLMSLPDDTVVYAGHDYVKDSMAFARRLEPRNTNIDVFLEKYSFDHVFSTMGDERSVNPYLRFNEASIIELLERLNLPRSTPLERWCSLMSID